MKQSHGYNRFITIIILVFLIFSSINCRDRKIYYERSEEKVGIELYPYDQDFDLGDNLCYGEKEYFKICSDTQIGRIYYMVVLFCVIASIFVFLCFNVIMCCPCRSQLYANCRLYVYYTCCHTPIQIFLKRSGPLSHRITEAFESNEELEKIAHLFSAVKGLFGTTIDPDEQEMFPILTTGPISGHNDQSHGHKRGKSKVEKKYNLTNLVSPDFTDMSLNAEENCHEKLVMPRNPSLRRKEYVPVEMGDIGEKKTSEVNKLNEGENEKEDNLKKTEKPKEDDDNNVEVDEYHQKKEEERKREEYMKKKLKRYVGRYIQLILISLLFVVFSYQLCSLLSEIRESTGPYVSRFSGGSRFEFDKIRCFKNLLETGHHPKKGEELFDEFCVSKHKNSLEYTSTSSQIGYDNETLSSTVCVGNEYYGVEFEINCFSEEGEIIKPVSQCYTIFESIIWRNTPTIFWDPYSPSPFSSKNGTFNFVFSKVVSVGEPFYLEDALISFAEDFKTALGWLIWKIITSLEVPPHSTFILTSITFDEYDDLNHTQLPEPNKVVVSVDPVTMMLYRKTYIQCFLIIGQSVFEILIVLGAFLAIIKPLTVLVGIFVDYCRFKKHHFQWCCELIIIFFAIVASVVIIITQFVDIYELRRKQDEGETTGTVDGDNYVFPNVVFLIWLIVLEFAFMWRIRCCNSWSRINFCSIKWWYYMSIEPFVKCRYLLRKRRVRCVCGSVGWVIFVFVQVYLLPRILVWGIVSFLVHTTNTWVLIILNMVFNLGDISFIVLLSLLCLCNVWIRSAWGDKEFEPYRTKYDFEGRYRHEIEEKKDGDDDDDDEKIGGDIVNFVIVHRSPEEQRILEERGFDDDDEEEEKVGVEVGRETDEVISVESEIDEEGEYEEEEEEGEEEEEEEEGEEEERKFDVMRTPEMGEHEENIWKAVLMKKKK